MTTQPKLISITFVPSGNASGNRIIGIDQNGDAWQRNAYADKLSWYPLGWPALPAIEIPTPALQNL